MNEEDEIAAIDAHFNKWWESVKKLGDDRTYLDRWVEGMKASKEGRKTYLEGIKNEKY